MLFAISSNSSSFISWPLAEDSDDEASSSVVLSGRGLIEGTGGPSSSLSSSTGNASALEAVGTTNVEGEEASESRPKPDEYQKVKFSEVSEEVFCLLRGIERPGGGGMPKLP